MPRKAGKVQKQGDIAAEDKPVKTGRKVKKEAVVNSSSSDDKSINGKSAGKTSRKRKIEENGGGDSGEPVLKTVVIKGKAPVDPECIQMVNKSHVFCDGNDVWDVMLNQTNLQFNNNKYYLIQLLEEDAQKSYYVWMRWGRVGKKGQNSLVPCGSNLQQAKTTFKKKFADKTKNDWDERDAFEKVAGKYDMLKMDYNAEDETDSKKPKIEKKESKKIESKLDARVKALIELICNIQEMEDVVKEMQYDSKKAPLGKLTSQQITAGYSALKTIEELLDQNKKGSPLVQACNDYYTRIPHDFGMRCPPLISSLVDLKRELDLLEALGDIQVAIKMLSNIKMNTEHPADRQYQSLKCTLKPLDKSSDKHKVIKDYLLKTHLSTHNQYKMELDEVFECDRQEEITKFQDRGNKMLLWHGSRLTNFVGILSQGLRIAPPEAPVTGYMFGKGIYFADRSSKSANYCYATRSRNIGLLLLCEVALGESRELRDAEPVEKLPKGKWSVKGVGRVQPDPTGDIKLEDLTVPLGPSVDVKEAHGYSLNYNEYIVYNPDQVRMRYLVKVKFNFVR